MIIWHVSGKNLRNPQLLIQSCYGDHVSQNTMIMSSVYADELVISPTEYHLGKNIWEMNAFSSRPSTIWGQESSALASNFWTVIREVGFGMKSPLMHSTNRVTYAIVKIRARSKSKPWSKHSPGRGELDSPNLVCKINAPLPKSKPSLCFK